MRSILSHTTSNSLRSSTLVAVVLILAFSTTAHAKLFKNAYVSFELPDKWDCVLEQTEWVCRPNAQDIAQQAIIILTAKEVGPNDSLPQYMTHLKAPRAIASRSGQPMQSQVMKVEQRNIANQPWIDGMHLGSEVQNYYTRYLATTKDKIAVLVTFSAHKLAYTKFSNDFFRAIESLRVVATKSLLSGNGSGVGGGPGSETLGINSGIGLGGDGEPPPEEGAGGKGAGIKAVRNILGLAVILAAIGIFLVLKRGKKKKKR